MGPEYPDVPGYDPVIQAMAGYMELTGDPAGPPTLCGIPLIDLKAGDEVYANVLLALAERAESGRGRADPRLDAAGGRVVADHRAAAARLRLRALRGHARGQRAPQVRPDQRLPDARRLSLHGDRQRRAVAAPDRDPEFARRRQRDARNQRRPARERVAIQRDIARVTARTRRDELLADLRAATIPHARIHDIRAVRELPQLRDKLTRTTLPDGRVVHMQPMAVDLAGARRELPFPPKYGGDTTDLLAEVGYSADEVRTFLNTGVVA